MLLRRFGLLAVSALILIVLFAFPWFAPESGWYWAIVALAFVYPFVAAPIAIRRRVVREIAPPIEAFDPARHVVPPWAHAFMADTAGRLAPESFVSTNVLTGIQKPLSSTWSLVFENAWTGDVAHAMVAWNQIGLGVSHTLVVFRSRFDDGTEMTTSNYPKPTFLEDPPPHAIVLRLPDVRDPVALYRIHRALTSRATATKLKLSCNGDPIAFQREASTRESERLVACGRYVKDGRAGVYRISWGNALRIAWRNTFPVSLVTRAMDRRRTQALVRELTGRAG